MDSHRCGICSKDSKFRQKKDPKLDFIICNGISVSSLPVLRFRLSALTVTHINRDVVVPR